MIFNLRTIRRILLASAILLVACFAVFELSLKKSEAAINPLLNFTGKVTDTGGTAVTDGVYNFSFGLYTTATSGTAIWSENLTAANMFAGTISDVSAGVASVTYTYNADSNDTTLRMGQYLTNATTGEYELITDYDAANNTVSVATTTAWSAAETINNRPRTEGGVVNIDMGAASDLSGVNFNQTLYLEVTFNSETMQPRKVITPVAAAFNADKLDGYDASDFANPAANTVVTGEWSFNNILSIATSSTSTALTVRQSGAGDIVNFFDGLTEVFTITDGGNVGIGTSTPYAKLSVWGSGNLLELANTASTTVFIVNAGGDLTMTGTTTMGALTYPNYDGITNQVLSTDGSGNIVWSSTAAATPHNLLSAQHTDTTAAAVQLGDLLIGGAGPNWARLGIGTGGYVLASYNGAPTWVATSSMTGLWTDGGATTYLNSTIDNIAIGTSTAYAKLSVWGSGASGLTKVFEAVDSASTTLFAVLDNGNIGIASSTPFTKFGVIGNAYIQGNLTTTGTLTLNGLTYTFPSSQSASQYLQTNGSGTLSWATIADSGTLNYGAAGSLTYYASSGRTATGTIGALLYWDDTNARLGIGTTSPYAKLSVWGSGNLLELVNTASTTVFAVDSSGNITQATWTGNIIGAAYGGTGVNSSGWTEGIAQIVNGTWSASTSLSTKYGGTGQNFSASTGFMYLSNGIASASSTIYIGNTDLIAGTGLTLTSNTLNLDEFTIGTTDTNATAGSVFFAGTNGVLQQDNLNLFWDDTNNRLGIGTSTPQAALHIGTASSTSLTTYGDSVFISGELEVGETIYLGPMEFGANSGVISWIDMPVTSSASIGTPESYTARLDGTDLLTIYAESDGAGGIQYAGVGIGSSTPFGVLSVQASSTRPALFVTQVDSGNQGPIAVFYDGGTEKMRLNSSGYLGIGTSSPAQKLATDGLLYVGGTGTSTIENNLHVLGTLQVGNSSAYLTANGLNFTGNATISSTGSLTMQPPTGSNFTINLSGAGDFIVNTNQIYADTSTGNVGIGTTSPYAKLSIWGPGTSGLTAFNVVDSASTTLFSILDNGNVGIASSSPFTKLGVIGNAYIQGNLTTTGTLTLNGITYTFPSSQSASQYLKTDGSGNLTWASAGSGTLNYGVAGSLTYYSSAGTTATGTTGALLTWDDTNARLGIGTTSPYSILSISNSASTAVNTPLFTIASTTAGVSTSTLMTVLANGYVGIGTATPNNTIQVADLINFYNTDYNASIGYQAGKNVVSGAQYNTFLGYQSGYSSSTASTNAADWNTAIGYQTLYSNTTGNYNSAMGLQALLYNTSGSNNVAVGGSALLGNYTGSANTVIGTEAGYGVAYTSFASSTLIGYRAGYGLTTGNNNILIGYQAGDSISSASDNTIIGYQSGQAITTTATRSTFLGYQTGYANTTGVDNTLMGYTAGDSLTTGGYNTLIGSYAGQATVSGARNTFLGYQAGYLNTASDNTFIGYQAGDSNTSALYNTFIGVSAGQANVTGANNTFLGYQAGTLNTASNNTFIGYQAGDSVTSGTYNTLIGVSSGQAISAGTSNTALGYQALYTSTGSSNSAIGDRALSSNTDGYNNSAMGVFALYSNITGNFNSAMGMSVLFYNQTGSANTVMGYQAGLGVSGNSFASSTLIGYRAGYLLETGSNNILLGYQAGDNLTTGASNIIIGYDIDAPLATSANTLNIGNLLFGTGINGTGTTLSSGNIGIGTTSPYAKLSVWGSGTSGLTKVFEAVDSASTTLFTILDNGRVGIGTSTPNNTIQVVDLINFNNAAYNSLLGYQAGKNITAGATSNTFIGYQSGYSSSTASTNAADNNAAIGYQTLFSNTTGSSNSAMGTQALYFNTTGVYNSAMGTQALYFNTTGDNNSAMGTFALSVNTTGDNNSAMGFQALLSNTTGNYNLAMGADTLYSNTTGDYNSAMGTRALFFNLTGSANTVMGMEAGFGVYDNSFASSTLIGYRAGYLLETGSNNILLGYQAGDNLTTGASNIIIGYDIDAPLATSANTLNIGNLIFGTGINGTGTTLSSGNIGIGTSTPYSKLSVWGSGNLLELVNTASTTVFAVDASGNITNATWTGNIIGAAYGGTGVNSSGWTEGIAQIVNGTWSASTSLSTKYGGTGQNFSASTGFMYLSNGIASASSTIFIGNTDLIAGTGLTLTSNTLNLDEFTIGTTDTNATAGSVFFAGTSGVLQQDNANFFWDDTSNRLGIGTSTPATALTVVSTSGAQLRLNYDYGNYADFTVDSSGELTISGSGASGSLLTIGDASANDAGIVFDGNAQDYYAALDDTDDAFKIGLGSTIGSNAYLTVLSSGNIGIGTSTPYSKLTVWGSGASGLTKVFEAVDSASTTLFAVLDNGNIGIGTTTPYAKLSVVDTAAGNNTDVFVISTSTSGTIFKVDGAGNVRYDGTASSPSADYAEYFWTGDTDLQSGEVVCVDITRDNAVKRCETAADGNVMGIVSTKPAIVGNAPVGDDAYGPLTRPVRSQYVIVGLLGQVPAKVSTENGEIRPGDSLTPASVPGYVMKANAGDSTVGVALEAFDGDGAYGPLPRPVRYGIINVLISRRNKSLTVETVEEKITERIADMEIEDEVNILIANAVENLNLDEEIAGALDPKLFLLATQLTATTDNLTGRIENIEDAIFSASWRIQSIFNQFSIINYQIAGLSGELGIINNELSEIRAVLSAMPVLSTSTAFYITRDGNVKLGEVSKATTTPDVAVVEIGADSDKPAFVVNQQGDGDVADFRVKDISIVNIGESGKVTIVGELAVDGRIMVCSGGACGAGLDEAVDQTMGDMGVEGTIVAGAFAGYCEDGFVWAPGSAKYGTLPGFCVMTGKARTADTDADGCVDLTLNYENPVWTNMSQGEAALACQALGGNYHLLSENEWLTIAENILRVSENDVDLEIEGMQLVTTTDNGTNRTNYFLTNGNTIYDLVGEIAEWTDQTVTKQGIFEPVSDEWQEYYDITNYKGFNIAPPYYYTSANGIGRVRTGDNENNLRGFVRGFDGVFSLDLSNSPATASSTIGFRCAR